MMTRILFMIGLTGSLMACSSDSTDTQALSAGSVLNAADVVFEELDGAAFGPNGELVKMGAGWGDRATGAHGTFGIFPGLAVSPPHTHTAAYHGTVLAGVMTNPFSDPLAPTVLLPVGSHWTVPAGEQHATTCVSAEPCRFYFHSEGAFDFLPIEEFTQTPSAEAVSTPANEIVFTPIDGTPFGPNGELVQFGPGFGSQFETEHGTFGIFPDGAISPIHTHSEAYYGVVISGRVSNPFNGEAEVPMEPGSLWTVPAESEHATTCSVGQECLFYFHSRGAFDFTPVE